MFLSFPSDCNEFLHPPTKKIARSLGQLRRNQELLNETSDENVNKVICSASHTQQTDVSQTHRSPLIYQVVPLAQLVHIHSLLLIDAGTTLELASSGPWKIAMLLSRHQLCTIDDWLLNFLFFAYMVLSKELFQCMTIDACRGLIFL